MWNVLYSGNVAKCIRVWCDKHADRVAEVDYRDGFNTPSGFGYDILPRQGWCMSEGHVLAGVDAKWALQELRTLERCSAENCSHWNETKHKCEA